ncbi:cyanophycin synthetase [Chryseobacterium chendengshani]|uniref:cyanophycin synthetase n=1 Tax=Chryseobacterium sp. LJ756 TaxID=2864113 RepID=UPI001C63C54F|nr:cyanophycin synthetase [Chryseobacterium sp. LJ756]MBW7674174.1 cyanophycin synthetase [Chryseobacterium sp. LJ756]
MITNEIRIMRGPNMWSHTHHRLIAIKYDSLAIAEIEKEQQQLISDFFQAAYQIESSYEDMKLCVFEYTLHLAAILQESSFYRDVVLPSPGIFYGLLQYEIEEVGLEAFTLASEIMASSFLQDIPLKISQARLKVEAVSRKYREGPSTSMIIEAARRRNIPVNKGPAGYTILGYGKNQKRISAAMSHNTSCIAVNIACDKEDTKKFLENSNLPVPKGKLVQDKNELLLIIEQLGFPLVTKPFNGNQGRNVTCGITDHAELLAGFRFAAEISKLVIVEKEIQGEDYRLLVIGNKFIAASKRQPAFIVGDGLLTIYELVEKENLNPLRGNGHEDILTKISLDHVTELHLHKQGLTFNSIPARGQQIFLRSTANLSTGGTAEDVTDLVHPSNILLVEKVSRVIGLDICGIDIISSDICQPINDNGGAIIEVNAAPGLRMHKYPIKGTARYVGEPIVDLMFPAGDDGRIPLIAITGTNGKTTTTRLMAHLAASAGYTVGFSSTDGIYVGGEKIQTGDCSGPQSARTILQDTTVDFAVLECARGGIIRSGLGFEQCDIAIVTNVAADHLGLKDIYTVKDLANVKAVVPGAVRKDGWAILNAADDYAYAMKDKVTCNVALFCSDENNAHLQNHMSNGGHAVYAKSNLDIFFYNGTGSFFMFNAADVPITRKGRANFMTENILPVILASYFSGIQLEQISTALKSFIPDQEQTPGRINEFEINGVNVIVDYAHNPHGLKALAGYLKNIPAKKLGIIAVPGDRRDADIIEFGQIAASMYDKIIIRFDRDTRGRSEESIVDLLSRGIRDINSELEYKVIADTQTAIQYAVDNGEKGSYVVICADNAIHTLGLTRNVAAHYQIKL